MTRSVILEVRDCENPLVFVRDQLRSASTPTFVGPVSLGLRRTASSTMTARMAIEIVIDALLVEGRLIHRAFVEQTVEFFPPLDVITDHAWEVTVFGARDGVRQAEV